MMPDTQRPKKKQLVASLSSSTVFASCILIFALMLFTFGCAEPMPDGRGAPSENFQTPAKRNFGEEIYKFILREAKIHPTKQRSEQRASAVKRLRIELIEGMNLMVPHPMLPKLEVYMRSLLPMYDDNTMPNLTREGALILSDLIDDEEALKALILSSKRVGLSPALEKDGSLMNRVLSFPKQKEMLQLMVAWWRDNDGYKLDPKTGRIVNNPSEKPLLKDLLNAAGAYLAKTQAEPQDSRSFQLMDFLLVEDGRLDLKVGMRCAVRLDLHGNPVLSAEGKKAGANVPVPFGTPDATGRGSCGEALSASGLKLYDFRDVSRSILGVLLSDSRKIILKELPLQDNKVPFPLNMTVGIRPLFGPVDTQTKGYKKDSPILKMLGAAFGLMKGPDFYKLADMLAQATEKDRQNLAALLAAMDEISKIADANPTDIRSGSTLFEDLLPFLQEFLAKPGFLEDLFRALNTKGLAAKMKKGMVPLFQYGFNKLSNEDYAKFKQGQFNAVFKQKVNHKSGDTSLSNSSYFQVVLHLLANVNRRSYTSRMRAVGGIPIPFIEMRIKNISLLYLKSVVGKLSIWETIYVNGKPIQDGTIKNLLKASLPAMGFEDETPNPEELGLFINKELKFKNVKLVGPIALTITLDPIYDAEGYELRKHIGPALISGLASGLIAKDGGALAPVAKVFDKYGKLDRFLDLLGVLHKHWASAGNASKSKKGTPTYPSPRTNLRSLEPLLSGSLDKTDVLEQTNRMGNTILGIQVKTKTGTEKATTAMQRYVAYLVGPPGTKVDNTPLKPFLDAADAMTDALKGKQKAKDAWESGMKAMTDLLMKVEGKGAQARFSNERAPIILMKLLRFFAEEIKRRTFEGQWGPDLKNLEFKWIRLLTDPVIPRLLDVTDSMIADRELLKLFTDFLVHVIPDPNKKEDHPTVREILGLSASLIAPSPNSIKVPIARFLGRFLQTRGTILTRLMEFLHRTIPLDKEEILIQVMKNGTKAHPQMDNYTSGVLPVILRDVNRLEPGSKKDLEVDDLKSIFLAIARYLKDETRGLEKLYTVIKQRNGPLENTK